MLDALTLDQMRILIAAADAGSFSAAGRRLGRAQSAVSQAIATLEGLLEVPLFERDGRYPRLTDAGAALLVQARAVVGQADLFKARAKELARGVEPELSVAVDVMLPIDLLTAAVSDFGEAFPNTALRLYVESLGAVLQPALDGRCAFAVIGTLPVIPAGMHSEWLLTIDMVAVASPRHSLASAPAPITREQLSGFVQLVLTDRTDLTRGKDFGVIAPRTWRLADLGAKLAFLRAGLGWGGMPRPMIAGDLASGTLVELDCAEEVWAAGRHMPMQAVHRQDAPPGPAGRWLIARLKALAAACRADAVSSS